MRRFAIAVPFLALAVSVAGCRSSKIPKLHTVTGKIVRDNLPIANAAVKLVSDDKESAAQFSHVGFTNERGEFTIDTIEFRTNIRKSGAPEGVYTVTVELPMDEKQSGGGLVNMTNKVTIVAGDNSLGAFEAKLPDKKK